MTTPEQYRALINTLNQAKNEDIYTMVSFLPDNASQFDRLTRMLDPDNAALPAEVDMPGNLHFDTKVGSVRVSVHMPYDTYMATLPAAEAEKAAADAEPTLSSRWDVV